MTPVVVGAAGHALGQEPGGALAVAGAEACLEQGVVEDIPLGAAAAQLDQPGLERLDPSDGRPVLRSRERLEALDERDEHRAHEPRGIPRSAGAACRAASQRSPSPRAREGHAEMRRVEQQALPVESLPRDGGERAQRPRPTGSPTRSCRQSSEIES